MNQAVRDTIKRILNLIPDPADKTKIWDLLRHTLAALADLAQLDEILYSYFSDGSLSLATEGGRPDPMAEVILAEVHGKTFRGMHRLTSYFRTSGLLAISNRASSTGSTGATEPDLDFDDAFDLGLEASSAPDKQLPVVDDVDLDRAFEYVTGIHEIDKTVPDVHALWDKVVPLADVLHRQTQEFDGRVGLALDTRRHALVLQTLDTAKESLTEGLFALALTVFEHFLAEGGKLERSALLPGYRNTLEQALLIRRGLADLRAVVETENDWVIKDETIEQSERAGALDRVSLQVQQFVGGDVFRAMRAADRLELANFAQKTCEGSFEDRRLACEGLAKYLESLFVVNQREMLIRHDEQVIQHIRHALEGARSLLMISQAGARAMLQDAMQQAQALYGRNPALDEQIAAWMAQPELWQAGSLLEQAINHMEELL